MDQQLKYFIFNKKADYESGYLENMSVSGGGIRPVEQSRKKSVFISKLLDSREYETVWHRMRLRGEEGRGISYRLFVYAGNEDRFIYKDQSVMIRDFLKDESVGVEEKKQMVSPWLQKQAESREDVLLHEVRGRYLWIVVEMYWQHNISSLSDIQIFFPACSWIRCLPEIYQKEDKNGFLERFLAIYQTIYEDFNERIREVPRQFDVDVAGGPYLNRLARWIDIAESYIWSEDQLRRLLKNGVGLFKKRGTRQGVIEFVWLYTGERPYVVENHQIQYIRDEKRRRETLGRLYGNTPLSFTVLVREEVVHTVWQQKTLIRIIEDVKPAQMQMQLVVIKPYIFAGRYSYLGINSVLGRYSDLKLDGHSTIPFAVIGKETKV